MSSSLDNIDVASEVFKSLVWDVAIRNVTTQFLLFFAISPTGVLASALTKITIYYAEKAYPYIKKWIKVGTVVLSNEVHQRSYEKAAYKLKVIAIESGINSDEFKKEREVEHEKQSQLVIFNIQYSN